MGGLPCIYIYIYIYYTHTVRAGRLQARMEAKNPASEASSSGAPSDLRTGRPKEHTRNTQGTPKRSQRTENRDCHDPLHHGNTASPEKALKCPNMALKYPLKREQGLSRTKDRGQRKWDIQGEFKHHVRTFNGHLRDHRSTGPVTLFSEVNKTKLT